MRQASPSLAADLQQLVELTTHSFLRYVTHAAAPTLVDDGDRALQAMLCSLADKENWYTERAYDACADAGVVPGGGSFPLGAPLYNFVRPIVFAAQWEREVRPEIARLIALRARLATAGAIAERAVRVADDLIALRTEQTRSVGETLLRLRPPAPAKPAPGLPTPAAPAGASPKSPVAGT